MFVYFNNFIEDANKENENASADIDEGKESNNVNHKRTYSTDGDVELISISASNAPFNYNIKMCR